MPSDKDIVVEARELLSHLGEWPNSIPDIKHALFADAVERERDSPFFGCTTPIADLYARAPDLLRVLADKIDQLQSQLEQLRAENVSLTNSLRDAYEFYMGPHACGDFTCECDQPKLCGICEIREATELALAKNLIDTSPVVNCNPSST